MVRAQHPVLAIAKKIHLPSETNKAFSSAHQYFRYPEPNVFTSRVVGETKLDALQEFGQLELNLAGRWRLVDSRHPVINR